MKTKVFKFKGNFFLISWLFCQIKTTLFNNIDFLTTLSAQKVYKKVSSEIIGVISCFFLTKIIALKVSFSFEKNISYFLQPIKRLQGLASRQQQETIYIINITKNERLWIKRLFQQRTTKRKRKPMKKFYILKIFIWYA